jgi:hypothetical protein
MEYGKSYKELKAIIIITVILTFIFAYNDNKPVFVLKNWLLNLFYVLILVSLIVLFNTLGYKLTAKYFGADIKIKVWNAEKFEGKFSLRKLGSYIFSPVLPILITLFSNGKIFLSSVGTFDAKNYNVFGKRFPKLSYFNLGLITIGGLFFNLVLMMLFKILLLKKGVTISSWFIIWNLLPISELPGSKIFFASRVMYLFSLLFFIANVFLIQALSVLSSLLVSFFFSILIAVIAFYVLEYLKS